MYVCVCLFNQNNNIEKIKKKKSIIICSYYNQYKKRLNKISYWAKQPFNEIKYIVATKEHMKYCQKPSL